MASTESAIGGGGFAGRIQRLAYAASAAVGAGRAGTAGNELNFRAIASVGLAALVGLPLLLIVSLALDAPFAAPAAIACGYLAAAAALYARWLRSAALISGIVVVALTAIAPLLLMRGGSAISPATVLALLLAPLLLAAPALTRFLLSRTGGGSRALMNNPPITIFSADKFEENTPSEKSFELCLVEIGGPVKSSTAGFHSDVGDAIGFAARRVGPAARDKNVTISCDAGKALAAACDRQTLRRIACLIAASAIAASPSGGGVRLAARRLRGAILLRTTSERAKGAPALADGSCGDVATARALVEDAGGTLLVEQAREQLCISVRLDLAPPKMANENGESGVCRVAS